MFKLHFCVSVDNGSVEYAVFSDALADYYGIITPYLTLGDRAKKGHTNTPDFVRLFLIPKSRCPLIYQGLAAFGAFCKLIVEPLSFPSWEKKAKARQRGRKTQSKRQK